MQADAGSAHPLMAASSSGAKTKKSYRQTVGASKNLEAQFLLFGGISSDFHGETFFNDLWILNVSSNGKRL
jgi:hypothetical protein